MRLLLDKQIQNKGANRLTNKKFSDARTHTSSACAGVQRQAGGGSPQNLLLGLWPLFFLIALLVRFGQAELEQISIRGVKESIRSPGCEVGSYDNGGITETQTQRARLLYLFGGVGRLGKDGLPVRPYKHDEREVEENQVDNWREILSRASGPRTYTSRYV